MSCLCGQKPAFDQLIPDFHIHLDSNWFSPDVNSLAKLRTLYSSTMHRFKRCWSLNLTSFFRKWNIIWFWWVSGKHSFKAIKNQETSRKQYNINIKSLILATNLKSLNLLWVKLYEKCPKMKNNGFDECRQKYPFQSWSNWPNMKLPVLATNWKSLNLFPVKLFEKCLSKEAKNVTYGIRIKVLIRSQPYLE